MNAIEEIEEWIKADEKISFANREYEAFSLSPNGVAYQKDFITKNRSSTFNLEKKFRYEYVCSTSHSNRPNIVSIRPVLTCSPVPYLVTINFKINNTKYFNTWNGNFPNEYYRVVIDSRLAPTLEITDWQEYRSMYRLSCRGKFISKILGTPDDVVNSLKEYNRFHKTDYSVYSIEIEIE